MMLVDRNWSAYHNGFDVFRFLYDACGPASAAHHNCFDVFSLFI